MLKRVIRANTQNLTNNVKRICNYLEVGRPMFVDSVVNGYRVNMGSLIGRVTDEETASELVKEIYDNLGIDCKYRIRSGYGPKSGTYDLIIPYAHDDELLNYDYKS